jgi:hypothetical protein
MEEMEKIDHTLSDIEAVSTLLETEMSEVPLRAPQNNQDPD